jgi:pyridoxal phosphate enzyme (YggS family)
MSLGPLNVLIQVNVSGEESKSGVAPQEVPSLAQAISALPSLRLRGLMAIPEPSFDEGVLRARFHALKELLDTTNSALSLNLDTLSMGMSSDYALAIEEGSTLVRIGSALFGERPPKSNPEVANEPIQS